MADCSGLEPQRGFAAVEGEVLVPGRVLVDRDGDRHAEAVLQLAQMRALLVQDVERHLGARAHDEVVRWRS